MLLNDVVVVVRATEYATVVLLLYMLLKDIVVVL